MTKIFYLQELIEDLDAVLAYVEEYIYMLNEDLAGILTHTLTHPNLWGRAESAPCCPI